MLVSAGVSLQAFNARGQVTNWRRFQPNAWGQEGWQDEGWTAGPLRLHGLMELTEVQPLGQVSKGISPPLLPVPLLGVNACVLLYR